MDSGEKRPGSSCSAQGPTEGGGNEGVEGGGGSENESGNEDDIDEDNIPASALSGRSWNSTESTLLTSKR